MHSRLKGTVKWFHEANGVGVISAEDGSGDYLVARSAILMVGKARLLEGGRVSFEPVIDGLAFWAFNVAELQP